MGTSKDLQYDIIKREALLATKGTQRRKSVGLNQKAILKDAEKRHRLKDKGCADTQSGTVGRGNAWS